MPFYVWLTLYAAALYLIWRIVKTGADEDAARDRLRQHLGDIT